jgi:galactokinase/mevalonate kinase-like predicted kinase
VTIEAASEWASTLRSRARRIEVTSTSEVEDPALEALSTLSDVATSGAEELTSLGDNLAVMGQRRRRGWTWRRILSSTDAAGVLAGVAKVASSLGAASGSMRRALARGLRVEGMRVGEIADLFDVSRQRVSALVRPRRAP